MIAFHAALPQIEERVNSNTRWCLSIVLLASTRLRGTPHQEATGELEIIQSVSGSEQSLAADISVNRYKLNITMSCRNASLALASKLRATACSSDAISTS